MNKAETQLDQPVDASVDEAVAADLRRDRIRSALECALVIVVALAIPAGLMVFAWRLAPGVFGRMVVQMAAVTMAIVTLGAGVTVVVRAGAARAAKRRAIAGRGRCARCGYSLEGLRMTTCPECGSALERAAAHSMRG